MPRTSSGDSYEGQTEMDMGHIVSDTTALPEVPRQRRGSGLADAMRRSQPRPSPAKNPFFKAASNPPGTTTQLYFQAKYYGPCPEISVEEESPVLVNVLGLMSAKKAEGVVIKCNL